MRYNFTIGGFQPFHNDHERLFKTMVESSDNTSVGILYPSSQDLFTYEEIKQMIEASKLPIEKIFPVKRSHPLDARREILKHVPPDAVFWSGDYLNVIVARLYGFRTKKVERGPNISGTVLRRMIHQHDGWRNYVNPAAASIIESKYNPI